MPPEREPGPYPWSESALDAAVAEQYRQRGTRLIPKRQRQWPRMVMGALAAYGVFSLVIHAVVAWEVLR